MIIELQQNALQTKISKNATNSFLMGCIKRRFQYLGYVYITQILYSETIYKVYNKLIFYELRKTYIMVLRIQITNKNFVSQKNESM